MSAPKQPERDHHHDCAAPWDERGQTVICEPEPGCEQIKRRQDNVSQNDKRKQSPIARIHATEHFLIAFGASTKDTTNPHVDNHADQENNVPRLDSHRTAGERPSTTRSNSTTESETPFSH